MSDSPRTPHTNHFADGPIDRAAERRTDRDWLLQQIRSEDAIAIPVHGAKLWIAGDPPAALRLPASTALTRDEDLDRWTFLGLLEDRAVFTFDTLEESTVELEGQGELADLRRVAALVDRADGSLLAYANALLHWQRSCRFCGRCGRETSAQQAGHVMHCSNCDREHYPRTSPAVIVLVHDGEERCVLGRQATWPTGVYSTLAGFVEPGESLEEAARREILEEVGVEIDNLIYDSSQPWPFPDSLMLGFHATAAQTPIRLAEAELEDARWFTREEVLARDSGPRLPPRFSIARRLIETWAAD